MRERGLQTLSRFFVLSQGELSMVHAEWTVDRGAAALLLASLFLLALRFVFALISRNDLAREQREEAEAAQFSARLLKCEKCGGSGFVPADSQESSFDFCDCPHGVEAQYWQANK